MTNRPKKGEEKNDDGPFHESAFPKSVFPRHIFPWMGEDDEDMNQEDEWNERGIGKNCEDED